MPVRWSAPCTIASRRSVVCCGQMTMSPISRGPAATPSSSTGNERTSVGASSPRCSWLSSVIRSSPTNSTATWPSSIPAEESASMQSSRTSTGLGASSSIDSTPKTSMSKDIWLRTPARPELGRHALRMVVVRGDNSPDELVANDVVVAEPDELDPLDLVQDVADDDQAGVRVPWEVDLRDVPGDDHLRVEAQACQEHLHLLRRRVLRLVEDDEAVVDRVVRHQEVFGDVQRVGRRDL